MDESILSGHLIDIHTRKIFAGEMRLHAGKIADIRPVNHSVPQRFILPGFIDAHIHIESSILVPAEFARLAVGHGTVATVSDPHEIANVMGIVGVDYMINNGNQVPLKFYFGAPSCVPATPFETAGAVIHVDDVYSLLRRPEIAYLSEMMNWPGVLDRDPYVMAKIQAALRAGKVVDGHAPGLKGKEAFRYASAGISTDHECFTLEEALDKLEAGMKIIIREGSAARNFDALIPLMANHASRLMFCSDDKHPDELIIGHINELVSRAVSLGYDLFDVLQTACYNPVAHYGLDVGLLRPGDPGDFIVVEDLKSFKVINTFIDGKKVFDNGNVLFSRPKTHIINRFECEPVRADMIQIKKTGDQIRIIVAEDGQLMTKSTIEIPERDESGHLLSNTEKDLLKIVVVNRYQSAEPSVAYIRGFGLKSGALASTVAHDSHNIIAVGVDDDSIVKAVNKLIEEKGGICAVSEQEIYCLPLPVAGLMSTEVGDWVAGQYKFIDGMAKKMGSTLSAPFMTLSFMALLVIPELKLSDKGLFDGQRFQFVNLIKNSTSNC